MCDKHKLVGVLFEKEPDVLSVVWAKQQKVLTSSDYFKKRAVKKDTTPVLHSSFYCVTYSVSKQY